MEVNINAHNNEKKIVFAADSSRFNANKIFVIYIIDDVKYILTGNNTYNQSPVFCPFQIYSA